VRSTCALAIALLRRDWSGGELRALSAALALAAASIASVSFVAQRLQFALAEQASQLLGGDLALTADHPMPAVFDLEARQAGLQSTHTTRFMSMALAGSQSQLVEVVAVGPGYPLRGELVLREPAPGRIPAAGEIWISERSALAVAPGARVQLGAVTFKVSAILVRAPDQALDVFNVAPRVLINALDLPRTQLIQTGSRVSYRLLLAGSAPAVERYRASVQPQLARGERLESVRDARPEVRNTLQRAERFLRLAACAAVVLAAVAVAMAARRFMQRHIDACAMLRCLGASQARILSLFLTEMTLLALAAGALGVLGGYFLHELLATGLREFVAVTLPRPGWMPALQGLLVALVLAAGFVAPALVRLRRVPTLLVLRRELALDDRLGIGAYALGMAALAALIFWQASDPKLAAWAVGGFALLGLVIGLAAWAAVRLLGGVRSGNATWRSAVARLKRYTVGSTLTIVTCSIGVMSILLLLFVRDDLLRAWNAKVPQGAPNRYLVNIQPEQTQDVEQFFAVRAKFKPDLYPIVRARLTAINGQPVSAKSYRDARQQRMAEREFNLSWAAALRADNRMLEGRWWDSATGAGTAQFSVEQSIAQQLGIKLGDRLRYHVAGIDIEGSVASIRHVDWDSMQINFYVLARPGDLADLPTSYIGSFYLPGSNQPLLTELVHSFPTLTLVDVDEIIGAVQAMIRRVSQAVRLVFALSALAGALAVYAALAASDEERTRETVVVRALGGVRRQILRSQLLEFAIIGLLAGVLATLGAWALAWGLSEFVLDLPYQIAWRLLPMGVAGAVVLTVGTAALRLRTIAATPPWTLLRGAN
jgi:putative ABC transport system permease protein